MDKNTIAQIKRVLADAGVTQKDWCQANDVSYQAMRDIMAGRRQGLRGDAHKVMVALGLRDGLSVPNLRGFRPAKLAKRKSSHLSIAK